MEMKLLFFFNENQSCWNLLLFLLLQNLFMDFALTDKRLEIIHGPTNATIFVDSHHVFYCRARGTPPLNIVWQTKNFSNSVWSFVGDRVRYSIQSKRDGGNGMNGSLIISRVLASDAGLYRCGVQHKAEPTFSFSTTVFLILHARAEIVTGPSSQVVNWGDMVKMTCEVVALPLPQRTWYQDGVQLMDEKGPLTGSVIDLQALQSCNITCQASNQHFNGSTTVSSHATLTVVDSRCEPLKNHVCLPYLTYTSVFSRLSQRQQLSHYNQLINNLLNNFYNFSTSLSTILPTSHISTFSGLSPKSSSPSSPSQPSSQVSSLAHQSPFCSHNLHLMLCHYANPQCIMHENHTVHVSPLCRESCQAIEYVFCPSWWHHNSISAILFCHLLPSMRQSTQCRRLDLFKLHNASKSCYHGRGDSYIGSVNTTSSGRTCQSWKDQQPHAHHFLSSIVLHLQLNHCRNPGSVGAKPWCFTMDSTLKWEYCDVPLCDLTNFDEDAVPNKNLLDQSDLEMALVVLACLLGVLVTMVLIIPAMVCLLKRRRRKRFIHEENEETIALNIPAHLSTISNINVKSHPPLLDRNCVEYVEDIANGAFGLVFKATLQQQVESSVYDEFVAIKMLKQDTNDVTKMEFVRQASIMSQFNHEQVLKLLGVCFIGDPCWVAVEYMERGDLRSFMPKMKLHSCHICILYQLSISKQITSALTYLKQRRFLHRDLAARNCLVSSSNVSDGAPLVKLADFTFTIELQVGNGVYVGMDDEAIAVRWAAPEAIQIGFFTFASDVWSFGVVLWEIFSFSEQPYQEFKHFDEISKHVRKGGILLDPCPKYPAIYRLMKKCWALTAEERCQCDDILSELTLLHCHYQDNKVS